MSNFLIFTIVYLAMGVLATVALTQIFFDHKKMKIINRIWWTCLTFALWPAWGLFVIYQFYRKWLNATKCAWCGELVDCTDKDEVREHVKKCKKHPVLKQLNKANAEIDRLHKMLMTYKIAGEVELKIRQAMESDGFDERT